MKFGGRNLRTVWLLINDPGVTDSDWSMIGLLVVDRCDSENLVAENTSVAVALDWAEVASREL